MVQTTLDSFIISDVYQEIELSILQKMTDEEALRAAEDKKIELITSSSNTTGYWNVSKSQKKFRVQINRQYGITKSVNGFRSPIAAAIYISQKVGDPMVCRAISQSFPEDSESQILINLCIPAGITNGNICDSKWRDKSKTLFSGTKSRTKDRNIHGRNHDEVEWNLCEFRKFIADELKKLRFVCNYSDLKLPPENASIERVDESKGYSSANCVLIDIHFQTGYRQWSREKVQSIHYLRKKEVDMDFGPKFFERLEKMVNSCISATKSRNEKGRNHSPSEVTVEKLIHEYVKQYGRCELLMVPLMSEGEWQMSVERLDENKGYIDGNWVLTVLATQNGYAQWTKEFVEKLWGPYSHPNPQLSVSEEDLSDKYDSFKKRNGHAISIRNQVLWTEEELNVVKEVYKKYCNERFLKNGVWKDILPNRTAKACGEKYRLLKHDNWTEEEDKIIIEAIKAYGDKNVPWKRDGILPRLNNRWNNACSLRKKYLKKQLEEALP